MSSRRSTIPARRPQLARLTLALLAVTATAAAGCADPAPTAPSDAEAAAPSAAVRLPAAGARGVTVMTRNIYLGGDILALGQPSPLPVPVRTAMLWGEILASNFPERAGALAREIRDARADLVGLQEAPIYRIDPSGDAAFGGTNPATIVALDFIAILRDSLAALGLEYDVAAVRELSDVELPVLTSPGPPPTLIDVRYTDREAILVRRGIPTSDPDGGTFAARVALTVSGIPIEVLRGWVSVQATVGGVNYRFVSTHLEVGGAAAPIQEAQAQELVAALAGEPLPIILVGDFNSPADGSGSATYAYLTGSAGFVDVWPEAHRKSAGYTSPLPSSLFGPPALDERIDLILVRQNFGAASAAGIVGGVHADVVGEELGDRTATGRWPSDHAGVVAILQMPRALARR